MNSCSMYLVLLAALSFNIEATEYWRTDATGRRYLIESDEEYNWFQASRMCQQQNMQLVEIESLEKNVVVVNMLRYLFKHVPALWLGATDEYNEAKDYNRPFYWSTTGRRMVYTYWSGTNPDNFLRNEHCVHIWGKVPDFKWNDIECTTPMGYICEMNHVVIRKCEDLQVKRQLFSNLSSAINGNVQEQQKQQSDILHGVFSTVEEINKNFADSLLEAQSKLQADILQLMRQHGNFTLAVIEEKTKAFQSSISETDTTAVQMHEKYSDEFKTIEGDLDDLLKC